jgi:cell fate (sporulation/competence/biofilm development) regulator YlbF (YheA/YmcA/DUF963 family)
MDIIEKAKELGNMIKESSEMAELKNSEAKMMQDEKARTILNDLYLLQDEMSKAMSEGKDREVLEGIQQKFISKQNEMKNYDITKSYLEDKSKFDNLMKQINDVKYIHDRRRALFHSDWAHAAVAGAISSYN